MIIEDIKRELNLLLADVLSRSVDREDIEASLYEILEMFDDNSR